MEMSDSAGKPGALGGRRSRFWERSRRITHVAVVPSTCADDGQAQPKRLRLG